MTEEDRQFLVARYDAEIRFTDDTLRELFDELETRGFFEDALVVVTSDHGEEFAEHGSLLHQGYLYEELLRVPLILQGERVPPGRVESGLVSSIDIAPTILAYAGLPVPDAMAGRDLLGERVVPRPVFAQYGPRRYALRTDRWKLIEDRLRDRIELYDLEADPGETRNLAGEEPERGRGDATRSRELPASLRTAAARSDDGAARPGAPRAPRSARLPLSHPLSRCRRRTSAAGRDRRRS